MKRYVALLRGVTPMNAKMPALRKAFEAGGFTEVRTVLSSGNVVFSARAAPERTLERRVEAALKRHLGSAFPAIVRSIDDLRELVESDPWAGLRARRGAKRVVTFLRDAPRASLDLPLESDGARILRVDGRHAFTAYVPGPRGPVFMTLIERTFGKGVTTRTWDTVRKVAGQGTLPLGSARAVPGG